jgi:7-cyano-7-deazaguanine synthase in queuosine biosynthesis
VSEGEWVKTVAFDFDGTLTDSQYPHVGKPKRDVLAALEAFHASGWRVMVSTCRSSLYYNDVVDFLTKQGVIYMVHSIHMGAKPIADLYVDDRGLLPDPDLLVSYAEMRLAWDRGWVEQIPGVETWLRSVGAGTEDTPFVNNIHDVPENPHALGDVGEYNDRFRVIVPLTGGMDSLTVWQMARESGLPYNCVYVDAGQEYATAEWATATGLTGEALRSLRVDWRPARYEHIIAGRNAAILFTIAEDLQRADLWGEVWFGNLAGESPAVGGDKSALFFAQAQALLTLKGYRLRIVNPLAGLDKVDEVAYWGARGKLDLLRQTKSCFHATSRACGRCQTCFRKWVAFKTNGVDIRDDFDEQDILTSFRPFIDKYQARFADPEARTRYSETRIRTTLAAIESLQQEGLA